MRLIIYYYKINVKINKNAKKVIFMNKYKGKSNISGKIIRKARIEKNISLEKLSNNLELEGIRLYATDIFLIENQNRILKDFELVAICKLLNIDIAKIRSEL